MYGIKMTEERIAQLESDNRLLRGKVKEISNRLKESLKEKEIRLREIHHRVKNNMQIISSILKLQAEHIEDPKVIDMFNECQNRIQSMALIHEKLYQSIDMEDINFTDYINSLVNRLFRSYGINRRKVTKIIEVGDVSTGVDAAISCGLIINELVSNSLKHAFPGDRKGEITLSLHPVDNNITLIVSDNGIGIPEDMDYSNGESLGLELVTSLVEDQLKGKIELKREQGTKFQITLKLGKGRR